MKFLDDYSTLSLILLTSSLSLVEADGHLSTYKATIAPLGDSGVSGAVVVFAGSDGTTVGYGGSITGLELSLEASTCTATNGCGVHIHSGKGCEDAAAQGGHYFVDPVTEDPWVDARYSSDSVGSSIFSGSRIIGTSSLEGHAFIVHAEDGSRVGCGLLTAVSEEELLMTATSPLGDSMVDSETTAMIMGDVICYMGSARMLEADLSSIHGDTNGMDCQATNGCGVHVHAGTDCTNSTTQMGHYYNADILNADPWAIIGYTSTDSDGNAGYVGCVSTGETTFLGKAFIIHANDGSRVSCGLLMSADAGENDDDEDPSSASTIGSTALLLGVTVALFW